MIEGNRQCGHQPHALPLKINFSYNILYVNALLPLNLHSVKYAEIAPFPILDKPGQIVLHAIPTGCP
ncbi:hypothetical protein DESC_480148 [Desulfosarcina cetonica]|nr:hypothetical protein DESC_480148 [Desulfosarcina cetonica]